MNRKKKTGLTISMLFLVASTAAGATVWIHAKLDEKISATEFDRYMNLIVDRLDSIDDRIRELGR